MPVGRLSESENYRQEEVTPWKSNQHLNWFYLDPSGCRAKCIGSLKNQIRDIHFDQP